jgi:hypothetical protein
MFFRPIIEVEDPAAFLSLAKDLKPLGGLIVFETDKGRYKFMTRQGDDVMSVSYTPSGPYPVGNPQGQVTHDIPIRPPYDTSLGWSEIYRRLGVASRLEQRSAAIADAYRRVLAASKASTLRWTSSDPKVTSLRIVIQNIGVQPTITIQYTDVHVRELSQMLEKAGFKVIPGKVTQG